MVATAQSPLICGWVESLRADVRPQYTVRPVVASPADIEEIYSWSFIPWPNRCSVLAPGLDSAAEKAGIANFEQLLLEVGKLKDPDAQDQHIVNIVDWLLQYAFEQRASDIHLEPRRDKGKVRFRIDGVLHLVYELPGNVMTAMVSRLKDTRDAWTWPRSVRPQDGRIKTVAPNGRRGRAAAVHHAHRLW